MNKPSLVMLSSAIFLSACGSNSEPPSRAAVAPSPAPALPPTANAAAPPALPDPGAADPPADAPFVASPMALPEEGAAPDTAPDTEAPQATSADEFAVAAYVPADGPLVAAAVPGEGLEALAGPGRPRLYVSPKGADANPGTQERPFRSLARAARTVRPGTLVLVAPGSYSGGLRSAISGSAGARITFLSTQKWGARITAPRNSPSKTAWDNRGSHVDIVGFEIDGRAYQGGVPWTHGIYSGGSFVAIRHNRVHHIAQQSPCNRGGGAAIGVDSYFGGVSADVIANLVHDIGPAGCRFVQGIYVSTSARVKNNVIYRVAEGGIHLWHDANNVIITNNTVTASNTGIIVGGGNFYHRHAGNDHTAVYSNMVYDNRMGISEQGKTGRHNTYRNNLVYNNSRYNWQLKNGLRHAGTVTAPPRLLGSVRDSSPNLRPAPGSPAIGMALPLHAESTDFAGRPRNAQAGFDIGAYQH
ncbi:DUF1565 domain-containing protein [Massilia sp. PAMC28688]|uniref:DUF1565 domain-containing protein n=1 Tax=Massilia sp. PAMC28688 TaxID=2861283 RepID=UPI001E2BDDC1|nr:DUF1565 domain-containing protein [Massilia sp. PAMC28688]